MRLFLVQAAALFLSLATASLSGSSATSSSTPQDITAVAGTTGPDHLSIEFQAPCPSCFGASEDVLDLTLEIDSAEEECSTTAPRLNGLPLVASNYGDGVASGQVFLQSNPADRSSAKDVHATWESACLKGEASIVSVRLNGVVGHEPLNDSSGFTTSFKQKGQPTVLRIQDKPVDGLSQALCDEWLTPDSHGPAITSALSETDVSVDVSLQAEYAKLAELQAEMAVLHEQIHVTLRNIMALLKQQFRACSSMRCIWDTAVKEASPIANLIATHFKQHKALIRGCREGDAQSPCTADVENANEDELEIAHDELGDAYIAQTSSIPPRPVETTLMLSPASTPASRGIASSSSTNYVQVFPPSSTSFVQATPISTTGGYAKPSATIHAGLVHGSAHPDQFALQRKLFVAILVLVLVVVVSGLAIRAIIKFRDPRRRAERAARWEERRTRRLYREAACKHKWRTFWKNLYLRKPVADGDEEKRGPIIEYESLLEEDGSGLSKEIRTMQNASDLVRDLMQAEEGRARIARHGQTYPDGFESAAVRGGVGSSRSSIIAPSFKSDVTPPPRYGEEIEGDVVIVDGFRYGYTPSNTDDTPESSIVDCSPRLSLETGRSTVVTKDTHD